MTLVFDTETTGKAEFQLAPEHILQPRLVQLGAILFDETWTIRAEINVIIKPEGFTISPEVAKIHGITQEIALRYGLAERPCLAMFAGLCARASILVAHNIAFDSIVIGRAFSLHKELPPVQVHKPYCTMNAMTDVCKLQGKYPGKYKWPTLQEAHKHCFGTIPDLSHDAMADVRACAAVYRWIQTKPQTT